MSGEVNNAKNFWLQKEKEMKEQQSKPEPHLTLPPRHQNKPQKMQTPLTTLPKQFISTVKQQLQNKLNDPILKIIEESQMRPAQPVNYQPSERRDPKAIKPQKGLEKMATFSEAKNNVEQALLQQQKKREEAILQNFHMHSSQKQQPQYNEELLVQYLPLQQPYGQHQSLQQQQPYGQHQSLQQQQPYGQHQSLQQQQPYGQHQSLGQQQQPENSNFGFILEKNEPSDQQRNNVFLRFAKGGNNQQ